MVTRPQFWVFSILTPATLRPTSALWVLSGLGTLSCFPHTSWCLWAPDGWHQVHLLGDLSQHQYPLFWCLAKWEAFLRGLLSPGYPWDVWHTSFHPHIPSEACITPSHSRPNPESGHQASVLSEGHSLISNSCFSSEFHSFLAPVESLPGLGQRRLYIIMHSYSLYYLWIILMFYFT